MRRQSFHLVRITVLIRVLSCQYWDIRPCCDAFLLQHPNHRRNPLSRNYLSKDIIGWSQDSPDTATQEDAQDSEQHTMKVTIENDVSFGEESDAVWKAYKDAMDKMITRPRVVKKAKPHEIEKCKEYLLSKTQRVSTDNAVSFRPNFMDSKEAIQKALQEQSAIFQQHYNFTKQEHEFITRCLVYIGDTCAKVTTAGDNSDSSSNVFSRLAPIIVAWNKAKEMGWMPRENAFSTYMYILSSQEEGNNSINVKNPIQSFCDDALMEVVTCHGWLYGRNEKTIAIQLKYLIGRRKVEEAEQLLMSLENEADALAALNVEDKANLKGQEVGLKLRTFLPLYNYYCEVGDARGVLKLYQRMQEAPGVFFDLEAHSLLLSSLARHGYFQPTSEHGPELFERLATNMAADVLEITPGIVEELETGFKEGFSNTNAVLFGRVDIPSNKTCPKTGTELRLISLDETQRRHVHDTLLIMARLARQEFTAKVERRQPKKKNNETVSEAANAEVSPEKDPAFQALLNFSRWLDAREGDPYTAIVDGANVAYYGHSNVHYSSLKLLVEKLVEMGETPLVVIPSKYTQPNFHVSGSYVQHLSKLDFEVIERLKANNMIYTVPRLSLDDYFWMLASVSNQNASRQGVDLSVSVDDETGRFPGMRPMIITNDQMRDHRLELLEPREFRRWCSCHIVNYHIGSYQDDEWTEERKIHFEPADYFSREIQGNMHPSGKGNVWHFPIANSSNWFVTWIER